MQVHKELKKTKALILDMDGVLVDTEPLHIKAFEIFLHKYGISTNEKFLRDFIGYSVEDNLKMLFKEYPEFKGLDMQKAIDTRNKIYLELIKNQQLKPLDGIKELIDFCLSKNIIIGLASSSDKIQVDSVLTNISTNPANNLDLYSIFSAIVSGDMVAQKKPWPDVYLKALSEINIEAENALAIEDSQAGIKSAKNAGMLCAALRTPYSDVDQMSGFDWIINSIQDQIDLFIKSWS